MTEDSLVTDSSLDWMAGYSQPDQNENVTITAISGKTITFSPALKYDHYCTKYYCGEVGLLTRNIVFKGDSTSDSSLFGGHLLMRSATIARISAVEFTRFGQQGVVGRYPVHFHMQGDKVGKNFYIKDSSIHHNYQRCVVVHSQFLFF